MPPKRPAKKRAAVRRKKPAKKRVTKKRPRKKAAKKMSERERLRKAAAPLLPYVVEVAEGRKLGLEDLRLLAACMTELPHFDPTAQAVRRYTDEAGVEVVDRCVFSLKRARHAIGFIEEHCRHTKGEKAGQPLLLELWQHAFVGNLFGWLRGDGTRRFREALLYIPRKNGKTTLAAAVLLYLLVCDPEPGAEIYSAAGGKDQASKIWEIIERMRQLNPALHARTESYYGAKSITYPAMGSVYRAVPSNAKLQHGGDANGVFIDELHVLDDELVEVMTTHTGSRRQPIVMYLTTADHAGESACNETLGFAMSVMANKGDPLQDGYAPEFLAAVWQATTEDDWTDPKVWAKVNPNLGLSPKHDYMRQRVARALRSPVKRNTFLRLHLNIQTDADVAWVPLELWDQCKGAIPYHELVHELRGHPCWGGLDLSSRKDLSSFALWFPHAWTFLVWSWMPKARAVSLARDHQQPVWLAWASEGYLELSEAERGRTISQEAIKERVVKCHAEYDVQVVSFDRWGANKLREELPALGVTMSEHGQGYRDMSEPCKELEALWMDEKMVHGGHPVLRKAAANTMVREDDAGNIKLSKSASSGPIDPIVACVMALGGWMSRDGEETKTSVYNKRGVIRL